MSFQSFILNVTVLIEQYVYVPRYAWENLYKFGHYNSGLLVVSCVSWLFEVIHCRLIDCSPQIYKYLILVPDLSHLVPIWHTLGANLTSLQTMSQNNSLQNKLLFHPQGPGQLFTFLLKRFKHVNLNEDKQTSFIFLLVYLLLFMN